MKKIEKALVKAGHKDLAKELVGRLIPRGKAKWLTKTLDQMWKKITDAKFEIKHLDVNGLRATVNAMQSMIDDIEISISKLDQTASIIDEKKIVEAASKTEILVDHRPGENSVFVDMNSKTPFSNKLGFTLKELGQYKDFGTEAADMIEYVIKKNPKFKKSGGKFTIESNSTSFGIKDSKLICKVDCIINAKSDKSAELIAEILNTNRIF